MTERKLYPYQEAGVRFLLMNPPPPTMMFYRVGNGRMECTGPDCPMCRFTRPQKRVVVKMLLDNKAVDLAVSATLAAKMRLIAALKPTRWQRVMAFLRRLFAAGTV